MDCIDTRNVNSVVPLKPKTGHLRDHADLTTPGTRRLLFGPNLLAHNSF